MAGERRVSAAALEEEMMIPKALSMALVAPALAAWGRAQFFGAASGIVRRKDQLGLIAVQVAVAVNPMNLSHPEYRQAQTLSHLKIDHRAKRAGV